MATYNHNKAFIATPSKIYGLQKALIANRILNMRSSKNMVGEKLRKLRKDRGLTQQQVEQMTGIAQKNISSYESGKLTPSGKTLQKFANALEIELSELNSEEPAEPVLAISDAELLQMFRELQKLPDPDKLKVKWMLGLAIKQHQVQAVMAS